MSYQVSPGSVLGRFGEGLGKALSEQVPKEVERVRLSKGLQELANSKEDLSPVQAFAKLPGIPGMTPQVLQSFGELLKQEGMRKSLRKGLPQTGQIIGQSPLENVNFANFSKQGQQLDKSAEKFGQEKIPSDFISRAAEAAAGKGLVQENPSQEKFQPAVRWSPQQREDVLSREWDKFPNLSWQEINSYVDTLEDRYLQMPTDYQKQYDYQKDKEKEASDVLDTRLQTSLQKEGKDIYGDLTGTTLLNMKKAMYNDLATNPKMTVNQAAEKWEKKAKDFVETKSIIKEKANRDIWDRLAPGKKEDTLKALESAQKIYDEMGQKKEFYDVLRSRNIPPVYETDREGNRTLVNPGSFGFDLSPGRAASISNPLSNALKQVINTLPKPRPFGKGISEEPIINITANSRKLAEDFAKNRTVSDSILSFARAVKDRVSTFDERAFFDYLRDNQDEFKFSPDQRKELVTGVSDLTPTWGDMALFPIFGGSK